MRLANYDGRKGWANTEPGWHEFAIKQGTRDMMRFSELRHRIVVWMYTDLPMCERHCRWILDTIDTEDGEYVLRFKFRREQDYLMFILKWA